MGQLKRLVIHCTATPEGRKVTKEDIIHWHTDPKPKGRGWKQVGYSDMIHLDGEIENLVPYNEDNVVDPWEITNGAYGYNSSSRHVVYVGGTKDGKSFDTRTKAQMLALKFYVERFLLYHPGAEVIGHNTLNPVKDCPCFNVGNWLSWFK
jgi:N-acetylmuramoyl-L-alanine amidase